MSEVLSLRVPTGTLERLKLLACRRSVSRQVPINWPAIVRANIQALLGSRLVWDDLFPGDEHGQ